MNITKEKETPQNKLQVDIFVPLNECSCMYEHFINRVFSVIMEYIQFVDFKTKSLDSDEARALNLHENCVVLEKTKIIVESFKLKDEIAKLLKNQGSLQK